MGKLPTKKSLPEVTPVTTGSTGSVSPEVRQTARANVGPIIDGLAKIVGDKRLDLLREIADFVELRAGGGDGELTRDTILHYDEAPDTACNYRFAALLLDYLDMKVESAVPEMASLRLICRNVLSRNRVARYSRIQLVQAPSYHLDNAAGTYVLLRRETNNNQLRQEVLVLSREGKVANLATYISPEFIARGQWGVIGNNLCCNVYGQRENGRTDFVTHVLDGVDKLPLPLFGVLCGLASSSIIPVTMLVCAIKVPKSQVAARFHLIGNENDYYLRKQCPVASLTKTKKGASLASLLKLEQLGQYGVLESHTMRTAFNGHFNNPLDAVDPRLLDFIQKFHSREEG